MLQFDAGRLLSELKGPRPRLVLRLGASERGLHRHHALPVRGKSALLAHAVPVFAVAFVPLQLDLEPVVAAAGAVGRRARHARTGGAGLRAVVAFIGRSAPPRADGHHSGMPLRRFPD